VKQTFILNHNIDDLKLFGLILECPLNTHNVCCCLNETELQTIEKKFDWLQCLDPDKKIEVKRHHQNCLYEKLKNNQSKIESFNERLL